MRANYKSLAFFVTSGCGVNCVSLFQITDNWSYHSWVETSFYLNRHIFYCVYYFSGHIFFALRDKQKHPMNEWREQSVFQYFLFEITLLLKYKFRYNWLIWVRICFSTYAKNSCRWKCRDFLVYILSWKFYYQVSFRKLIISGIQFFQEHGCILFLSPFLLRQKRYLVNLRYKLFEVVHPYRLSIFSQIQYKVRHNLLFYKSLVQIKCR